MTPSDKIDIHSYLDGELGPDEAAEIEARLENDPEAQARLTELSRQKDRVGEALTAVAAGGKTDLRTARLERRLAAAMHRQISPRRASYIGPWARNLAQIAAACALITFGWWGHATFTPSADGVPEYVSEAVGAHRVFAEDTVRPAEFTGSDVEAASEWFSSKIGVQVNAPDLADFNMGLVGARLLGTKEGPLAQFIYEGASGERFSLTLARHPIERPLEPLQLVQYPNSAVGYWSTSDIDFALVGNGSGGAVEHVAATLASLK